ncbi:hypothetical protein D9619_002147 [Psilocybe cf. subviscida]|uniref:Uncharacterized protein n=1 Tax=Psilocybe cf. subviscida TaxID=2480587 RepID=A0A8H5BE71_9AGAR|nr:hypothetical protein D9619_002147 [Psilocybe cf. subviscida]
MATPDYRSSSRPDSLAYNPDHSGGDDKKKKKKIENSYGDSKRGIRDWGRWGIGWGGSGGGDQPVARRLTATKEEPSGDRPRARASRLDPPPTQSRHPPTWRRDQEYGYRTPTPPRKDNPQTSSSANPHNEGFTREMERADLGARQMKPPARHRHSSPSSAAMFTNAQVNAISGGTFHNVAHNYESNAPAPVGVSVLQYAGLASLHVTSTATLQYYLYSRHPQVAPPPVPSDICVVLHFSSLYREAKIAGSFALWVWFIKMWVQRRAIHHR